MKINRIIASPGSGKTFNLMKQAAENKGVFVCQNAEHMREKAVAYGFSRLPIMSFEDFINSIQDYPLTYCNSSIRGYRDPEGRKFYIDEIEGFVNFICLNTFGGYTSTLE